MDLKAFVQGESPHVEGRGFAGIAQGPPRKPIIAAIEGFAVAGGLEVALACDLIVAARGAKLGIPEAKRSLVAAGGALLRLPQRMPYHLAMEMALTGDPISAERGAEVGLVNRLAEPGEAVAVARELAAAIAANGPLALDASKRILAGAGRLERGGGLAAPGRDRRPGLRLRGRPRGRDRLRREARPGLEGPLGGRRTATALGGNGSGRGGRFVARRLVSTRLEGAYRSSARHATATQPRTRRPAVTAR